MDYILLMHGFDAHRNTIEGILAELLTLQTHQDIVKRAAIHFFKDDEKSFFVEIDGVWSHDEVAVDGVV